MFYKENEKAIVKNMSAIRSVKYFFGVLKRRITIWSIDNMFFLKVVKETRDHVFPITLSMLIKKKIFGKYKNIYWPIHATSQVVNPKNICIGIDTSPGLSAGCYIQGIGKVYIGDYTGIAPNVGIISANHSILDFRKHEVGVVKIGKYCWIAMGSVILPNVELGDFTIVKPNSVVNKSFKRGHCVIGGNPAEIVKEFPEESFHLFNRFEHKNKYIGFIPEEKFEEYRKSKLYV
tara:strand:+ start:78 stop:776 length:699 start_codon:yes stop_codon:yes gene_type:complete